MTPLQIHFGAAKEIYPYRTEVFQSAFERSPLRFKGKTPVPPQLPQAAWINKPKHEQNKKLELINPAIKVAYIFMPNLIRDPAYLLDSRLASRK